jgi:hypothetical protein
MDLEYYLVGWVKKKKSYLARLASSTAFFPKDPRRPAVVAISPPPFAVAATTRPPVPLLTDPRRLPPAAALSNRSRRLDCRRPKLTNGGRLTSVADAAAFVRPSTTMGTMTPILGAQTEVKCQLALILFLLIETWQRCADAFLIQPSVAKCAGRGGQGQGLSFSWGTGPLTLHNKKHQANRFA